VLLRFVLSDRDERTGRQTGLMTMAYGLLRSGDLFDAEENELRRLMQWLESNLPIPDRFARKRNVSHKQTHGISWVRSDAVEAVRCLRAIADIAWRNGHSIEILQTERPGYIVYEDEWQVVAEPFHGEQHGVDR
jgi:hypothetical protein